MKRVKTGLALILALIIVLSFSACSKDNSTIPSTDTASMPDSPSNKDSNNKDSKELLPEFDKSYDIEETLLTDTYDVRITATQLSYSSSSVSISLRFENKSDENREVYAGTAGYGCNSINGYMIHDGYLRRELDPGATEEDNISFSYDELFAHGIREIADIGIGFDIEDSDYHHEYSGMKTIKTKKAESYDYTEDTYIKAMKGSSLQNAYGVSIDDFSEQVLYTDSGVKLISEAIATNKNGDRRLMLEFHNESDQDLYVKLTGLTINKQEVSTSFLASDLICSNKRDVVSVSLNKFFEENTSLNNQEVQSIGFSVELTNLGSLSISQKTSVLVEF